MPKATEPDIRILSIIVEVDEEEGVSEPRLDLTGLGYYEALGMLTSAMFRMAMHEAEDDEEEDPDPEGDVGP